MIPVPNGPGLFILLATLVTTVLVFVRYRGRSALPYPPGPRKLPVVGNLLDLPSSFEWETYARWGKEYKSDILHLSVAGSDIIVLNSFNAAIDLLEKKSSMYSSRPQFRMITQLMGFTWLMVTLPYGERWRERRRAFTQYFQASNTTLYQTPQMEFIRKMLPRLLDTSEDFLGITQHAIGGMALSLAYGLKIQTSNDPFISLSKQAAASFGEAAMPGAFLVEVFPILKYVPEFVPGAGFQKKARIWRRLQEDMRELAYKETIQNMASGVAIPSFTSTSLEVLDEYTEVSHQQEVIKDTAGNIFPAAADTTTSGAHTFFVAMLCYPEAQKKAQQELDRVLGGRLPDFSDEPDLPYISAIVREVLRWKPVTPVGVPHYASEDDAYQGYHIPKGSVVIPNAWAMLYDEENYPDPSAFKPERFLKDGKLDLDVRDSALIAFGFGRRICPGSHVAMSALWLMFANILATFEISKAVDDKGTPIEPSIQYKSILVCHPLPFKCTIKARSKAAEELIRSAEDSY